MEHIERSHPLGVTLGEVVIDRHNVHSLAGQCVKEHRKGRHKGLALTGRHLRDLALMQHDTTDQLDVIVNHVPCHLVAAGDPVVLIDGLVALYVDEIVVYAERAVKVIGTHLNSGVLLEPAGRGFHDGESLRKNLLQNLLYLRVLFLHKLVGFSRKTLFLMNRNILVQLGLDLGDPLLERSLALTQPCLQLLCLGSQLIIGELVYRTVSLQNLVENRSDLLEVSVGLRAEHFFKNTSYSHKKSNVSDNPTNLMIIKDIYNF